MPFNIKDAKAEGYSDKDIAEYLSQSRGFDISSARAEGYKDNDIVEYLVQSDYAAQPKPPEVKVPKWGEKSPNIYGALGAAYETGGPLAEMLGLGGGAVLGAPAGPAGAIGGGGLGFAAGKNLRESMGEAIGVERPKGFMEQLSELPGEVATGASYEAGGQLLGAGVSKGLEKLFKPAQESVVPGLLEAERELQRVTGTGFSPAQKTESRIIDTLEEVAEKSLTGSGKFYKFRLKQEKALNQYVDDVVNSINKGGIKNLTPEESGILLKNTIEGGTTAFDKAAQALYKNVDDVLQTASVNMISVKKTAGEFVEQLNKGVVPAGKFDTVLKNILSKGDVVTFEEAQIMRSDLLKVTRQITELIPARAEGMAKQLAKTVDSSMEASARSLGNDALSAWRNSNKFYKAGKEKFNNKFIKSLMGQLEKNPEVVIDKVFQNARPGQIRRIKSFVNDETFQTLKSGYLEKLITDSSSVDGAILGKTFLGKLKKAGNPALNETFTAQELERVRMVGRVANTMQKSIGGSGGMLIQLTQGTAILGVPAGILAGQPWLSASAAPILIGPNVLARIMVHPKWSKWLAEGLKTPATTKQSVALASKLTAVINKIGQKEEPKKDFLSELSSDMDKILSGRGEEIEDRTPITEMERTSGRNPNKSNRLNQKLRDFRIAN